MKDFKKCIICGAREYRSVTEKEWEAVEFDDDINTTSELVECCGCGELVCSENDNCNEVLNEEDIYCKKCIDKMTLCDCNNCKNKGWEECMNYDGQYDKFYNCPDYEKKENL